MSAMSKSLPQTVGTSRGMTVEGASAELLKDLLRQLEGELRRQGAPVKQFLLPGAQRREVEDSFKRMGVTAPDEAVVWFGWHNGAVPGVGNGGVLPLFEPWPLSVIEYERPQPWGSDFGPGRWEWDPNWIHIMGNQYGLAMSCADDPAQPPLIRFVTSDSAHGTEASQTDYQVVSLCTPVTWWIDSLQRGWYQWDDDNGYWQLDRQAQPLIRSVYQMS
jgi:hypothetical protein